MIIFIVRASCIQNPEVKILFLEMFPIKAGTSMSCQARKRKIELKE